MFEDDFEAPDLGVSYRYKVLNQTYYFIKDALLVRLWINPSVYFLLLSLSMGSYSSHSEQQITESEIKCVTHVRTV